MCACKAKLMVIQFKQSAHTACTSINSAGLTLGVVLLSKEDKYQSFEELQMEQNEGHDFRVQIDFRREANIVIIAPHGGGIEPGTSELAIAIAGEELSFAVFEGLKPEHNGDLHITSTHFDEPRCLEVVKQTDTALAIHGERSNGETVYIGGLHDSLISDLTLSLRDSGFTVKHHTNPNLQGISLRNICNKGVHGAGVQLELSKGLRSKFFKSLNKQGRAIQTLLFNKFVIAVRQGLSKARLL